MFMNIAESVSGQLYSIPEPAKQGLVATECVCRIVLNNDEEVPMGIKMKQAVRGVRNWLQKYHVVLVCILSVIHIGLSCIHTRDSGRTDLG
jgi:hypothetical protein